MVKVIQIVQMISASVTTLQVALDIPGKCSGISPPQENYWFEEANTNISIHILLHL